MIALIRASGSISRIEGPLSVSGSGIVGEKFIEKIRSVRGTLNILTSIKLHTGRQAKFSLDVKYLCLLAPQSPKNIRLLLSELTVLEVMLLRLICKCW